MTSTRKITRAKFVGLERAISEGYAKAVAPDHENAVQVGKTFVETDLLEKGWNVSEKGFTFTFGCLQIVSTEHAENGPPDVTGTTVANLHECIDAAIAEGYGVEQLAKIINNGLFLNATAKETPAGLTTVKGLSELFITSHPTPEQTMAYMRAGASGMLKTFLNNWYSTTQK